jgi:hypothetical protein
MTTKWISQIFSGGNGTKNVLTPPTGNLAEGEEPQAAVAADTAPTPEENIDYNKYVVLLLYGKNSFNDQIYSYLKISLGGIEKLKAAVLVGNPFTPSDFGTIIAAGRGEPSDEVRAEISSQYYVLTAQTEDAAPPPAATVTEKKSWDEF